MKLTRIFLFALLVAASGIAAFAQTPVDPTIQTQKIDPACGFPTTIICYDGSAPLSIVFTPTLSVQFEYTPVIPSSLLTDFKLDLTSVPTLTSFGCQTDIWVNCSITDLGSGTWQFEMSGGYTGVIDPIGTIKCNYNDGAGGFCPGYLANGDGASINAIPLVSETPEPASVILFGTGLLSIFKASKRRIRRRA
jgi:hypothetical protein